MKTKDSITEKKLKDMTMDELTEMLEKAEKDLDELHSISTLLEGTRDYIKAYIKYRRKDDLSSHLEAENGNQD